MGRPKRGDEGRLVYHERNRGNGRMRVFCKDTDDEAFEAILTEACKRYDMRLLAWVQRTVQRIGLKTTLRPRSRPQQGQPQQKKAAARNKGS